MNKAERNKEIIRRSFEAGNNRDINGGILDITTPDYVHHWGKRDFSAEGIKDLEEGNWRQFGCSYTIDDILAEGDKVAVRWTLSGEDRDNNNKPTTCKGISILRFEDDKIAESWEYSCDPDRG